MSFWDWLLHDPIWVGNSIMSRGNLIVAVLEFVGLVCLILLFIGVIVEGIMRARGK